MASMAMVATALPAGPALAAGEDAVCIDDPAGDTVDNGDGSATDEPRADVLQQCTTFGASLEVEVSVAEPTNPSTDAGWMRATFVGWFVDINGDDDGDFFIDYGLDAGGDLTASVIDLRGDEQTLACVGSASYTGRYLVSGVTSECLGGATEVTTSAGIVYDDGTTVHRDTVGSGVPEGEAVQEDTARKMARLAGSSRYGTAVAISQAQFPDPGVDVAYLARADLYADAVAGGALTDGPVLLVPSCDTIPSVVTAELRRLDPARVTALGGAGAICDDVLRAAGEAASVPSQGRTRLAGVDRFATSVAIAQRAFPDGAPAVYVARSDVFVDAVAGGVLVDGPVLLVPSAGSVPSVVKSEIARLNPAEVIALGGSGAVADATLADAAGGRATARLAGANRYATATQIARRAFPQGAPAVYLARADEVVDAVAGGVLTDGPVLVVDSCGALHDAVSAEIARLNPNRVVALGGEGAICQAVLDAAAAA